MGNNYLALCLMIRDEGHYLREWLEYHFLLGVDHVVIYDNKSGVPVKTIVQDYLSDGRVSVREVPDMTYGRQVLLYGNCLREFGNRFHWIGFIDADEFLVPKTGQNLPEFLTAYEEYGGLGVYWFCFGSNYHLVRPDEPVVDAYTLRSKEKFEENNHIKTIVNCRRVLVGPAVTPHHFRYKPGYFCVDENKQRVEDARTKNRTSKLIQLNHYFLKSREEFGEKCKRGSGMGNYRNMGVFDLWDDHCNMIHDVWASRVRFAMKKRKDNA